MSQNLRLTDAAIRDALAPTADVRAPSGLADAIRAATAEAPQHRRHVLPWPASRRARLVLRLSVAAALLILAAAAALLFVGSQRASQTPPSTMLTYHGGPERTGVLPGPAPSGTPAIAWTLQLRGPAGPASPVVADGVAYLGDEAGFVTAIDAATGRVRWQRDVGAPVNSPLTLASGLLLVGDDAGVLHAIDPAAWQTDRWDVTFADRIHAAPAVLGTAAYVGDLAGDLKAIDLTSGAVLWSIWAGGAISRSLAASGDTVYAGVGGGSPASNGMLVAYDAATGRIRWSAPVQPGNVSTPTVVGGRVIVSGGLDLTAATAHLALAVDAATGAELWRFAAPSGRVLLPGAADALTDAILSQDGNVYVLDLATGAARWQLDVHAGQTPNAGLVGGVLYVSAGDAALHAIDLATQRELWSLPTPGQPQPPAIIGGRIIVATALGQVVGVVGESAAPSSP